MKKGETDVAPLTMVGMAARRLRRRRSPQNLCLPEAAWLVYKDAAAVAALV